MAFWRAKNSAVTSVFKPDNKEIDILGQLFQLSEEKWDADAEQSLCTLWDMTADKDVSSFLVTNEFFDIFCKVVRTMNNARCLVSLIPFFSE